MSLSSFAYFSELILNTFSEHCRSPDEKQPLLPLGLYILPKVLVIVICLSSFLILLPQTTTKQHFPEKKKKTFMRNQLIKRLLNSGVNRKLSKSKLSEQFGVPSCQGHCPKNSNTHQMSHSFTKEKKGIGLHPFPSPPQKKPAFK